MKRMIIIDYKLGNLFSVKQAFHKLGIEAVISDNPETIRQADALVLPGVGAFHDAMKYLSQRGLVEAILSKIGSGAPILGICLGMQLLFSESEEFGSYKGLNAVKGTVRRFENYDTEGNKVRVPHVGWNKLSCPSSRSWEGTPLQRVCERDYFYFVHSFYVVPDDENQVLSKTSYGLHQFTSTINVENIFACQYHPEKSGPKGLGIYKNWIESLKW